MKKESAYAAIGAIGVLAALGATVAKGLGVKSPDSRMGSIEQVQSAMQASNSDLVGRVSKVEINQAVTDVKMDVALDALEELAGHPLKGRDKIASRRPR